MNNAPKKFLHLFLPGWLADFIDVSTNTQMGSWVFQRLLTRLGGNMGKRYASFLKIGKSKNQLEVFEDLMRQYNEPQMKFVALTMYMEETGAGGSSSGYEGQLEEILKVRQNYPDRLLIFLGVDPRWKNNGPQLRKTVESYFNTRLTTGAGQSIYPFCGLKIYPSTGFYPFDRRLTETFEWAAENKIPVLSHCNYQGGIFTNDPAYIKSNLRQTDAYTGGIYPSAQNAPQYIGEEKTSNNRDNCSYFMEPNSFRSILTYFQKKGTPLKLCLAHYGGSDHILAEHGKKVVDEQHLFSVRAQNWCGQIRDMMNEFSTLYSDISFALAHEETHALFFEDLKDANFQDRLMYGTDFFLTEQVLSENTDYSRFRKKAIAEILPNGRTAWDQLAHFNTEEFLLSRYYPVQI